MWIKDMFFFHEHPRKINWLEFPIILSPYLGPLITAFIVYKVEWQWSFWTCTVLWGIGVLLIFLLDEPLYDRSIPEGQRYPRKSRWSRIFGIEQWKSRRERSLVQSCGRFLWAITRIPVLLTVIFYFLNFAWVWFKTSTDALERTSALTPLQVISVNTTVSIWLTSFYGFNPKDLGEID